jgi:hypothetical protein
MRWILYPRSLSRTNLGLFYNYCVITNVARRKKKQPAKFSIPEKLLHQLNECSKNGFVLFNFDDDGEPQIAMQFDDHASAMALQNHVAEWIDAIRSLRANAAIQNIIHQNNT